MDYQIEINDYIGTWGFSKDYVRSQLEKHKGKPVAVRISSLGGAIVHGLDIRQQFIDHGDVTAYLYGMVASAATVLAMGAKRVLISKHALFLIHQVSNWVDEWGQMNADQIQKLIDELKSDQKDLKTIDLQIAKIYADRTHRSIEEMHQLMKQGAWMTAEQAVKLGFADGYVEKKDEGKKLNLVNMAQVVDRLQLPGLPAGLADTAADEEDGAAETGQKLSLLDRLVGGVKGVFSKDTNTSHEEDNHFTSMREEFVSVNSTLQVKGLECTDDKVTLTVAQVQALNDRIAQLEKSEAEKQQTIEAQAKRIEALQKADGGETVQVREGGKTAKVTAQKMFNDVKEFI